MKIALHIYRILWIFCISLYLGTSVSPSYGKTVTGTNLIVVELFTSQGCSACPPADMMIAGLKAETDILALSYAVDYWNYLGWTDTFAQPDCTIRQRKYNRVLGKSGVYTPQMIIQGQYDVVGSHKAQIRQIIRTSRKNQQEKAGTAPDISFDPFSVNSGGDMIELKISAGAYGQMATIWIMGYDFVKKVHITGGELSGQQRSYHNVVTSIKRVGSWMGEEIKLTLSRDDIGMGQNDAYAVILQQGEHGPILAARKLVLE